MKTARRQPGFEFFISCFAVFISHLPVAVGAAICLVFAASLRDTPLSAPPARAEDAAQGATLRVTVTEDGAPASGVRLRVIAASAKPTLVAQAVTDGGTARLNELPRGPAWLVADKEGFARASRAVVLGADGEVTLALSSAQRFEVVIVDEAQRPIKNASVLLFGADPLPVAAFTDASGLAAFAAGPPPYSVVASAQAFGQKLVREAGLADSPLFLKLERDAELAVRVIDLEGRAAPRATVRIAGSALWPPKSAVSDDAGEVIVHGIARGYYELRAERGDLVSEPGQGALIEHGGPEELTLRLTRGAFVDVVVTDGDGDAAPPIAGADVALVEGGLSSFPLQGRTGAAGRIRLGPIAAGLAAACAQAPGFVPKSAVPVDPSAGEVRVGLLRGGTIAGRVIDEHGFPVEGAELEVIGVSGDGTPIADTSLLVGFRRESFAIGGMAGEPLLPAGELGVMPVVPDVPRADLITRASSSPERRDGIAPWVSRGDGTFELSPVTPGTVQLIARHPAFVEALTAPLSLAPAGSASFDIILRRGGSIEGRLVEQDRTAVAGARIEIAAADGSGARTAFSADDGSFAFSAVPDDVQIAISRAEDPETVVLKLSVAVEPGQRRELDLTLPEPRLPTVLRVLDDRGFRLDGAEIHAASLDVGSELVRTVFTGDGGTATLAGGRGLPLSLTVKRPGHAPLVTEVQSAPAELTLTLDPEVEAEGDVHSRDGWLAGAKVTLVTAAGDRHAETDAAGRFHFGDLAAGRARLLVTADGYAFDEHVIKLDPSPRGVCSLGTIELRRGGEVEGVVVDARGDPVVGARVAVGRVPTFLPLGPLPPGVAQTDGSGHFVLKDVEPGPATIEAYKAGAGRDRVQDIEVRPRETVRDVRVVLGGGGDETDDSSAPASLAVTLSELTTSDDRIAVMLAHVPYGGEAQRAGLCAGDQLMEVDGVPLRSIEQARRKLDGALDSDMVLELYRSGLGRFHERVRRERLRR